jgi:macrophage erythroblast attacher
MYRIPQANMLPLEQSLLKVPHDQLKRLQRNEQRYWEKILSGHEKTAKKLCRDIQQPNGKESVMKSLDSMAKQLTQLKRKLESIQQEQQQVLDRTNVRLAHLERLCRADHFDSPDWEAWSTTKVNSMIADFLMREGWKETAEKLVKAANLESIVDASLFEQAQTVSISILDGDITDALKWCADNKNGLRKIKSTLEFKLRLQEFIELNRQNKKLEAIEYARTYLNPLVAEAASDQDKEREAWLFKEKQRAMVLLAFPPDATIPPYCEYYHPKRWQELRNAFLAAHVELHSLPLRSLLSVSLQAGLSTLKTVQCVARIKSNETTKPTTIDARSHQCPVCTSPLAPLAARLPRAHHEHSSIVCRISGRLLGGEEMAGCGPNGQVYSWKALEGLAAKNNGLIRCPVTGDEFTLDKVKRVFIM